MRSLVTIACGGLTLLAIDLWHKHMLASGQPGPWTFMWFMMNLGLAGMIILSARQIWGKRR